MYKCNINSCNKLVSHITYYTVPKCQVSLTIEKLIVLYMCCIVQLVFKFNDNHRKPKNRVMCSYYIISNYIFLFII